MAAGNPVQMEVLMATYLNGGVLSHGVPPVIIRCFFMDFPLTLYKPLKGGYGISV